MRVRNILTLYDFMYTHTVRQPKDVTLYWVSECVAIICRDYDTIFLFLLSFSLVWLSSTPSSTLTKSFYVNFNSNIITRHFHVIIFFHFFCRIEMLYQTDYAMNYQCCRSLFLYVFIRLLAHACISREFENERERPWANTFATSSIQSSVVYYDASFYYVVTIWRERKREDCVSINGFFFLYSIYKFNVELNFDHGTKQNPKHDHVSTINIQLTFKKILIYLWLTFRYLAQKKSQ